MQGDLMQVLRPVRSTLPQLIELPQLPLDHIQGREPPVAHAEGVEAHQPVQAQHLPITLWRMTHDRRFSRQVRQRTMLVQMNPVQ